MTTVTQQKQMFYAASLFANIEMLADRVGQELDFKYLQGLEESELRQLQDDLIEQYNQIVK